MRELSITVAGGFLGSSLEFVEGPLTLVIEGDRIHSISRGFGGTHDMRGYVILPPLANMHTHILDYVSPEIGWDLDIDSVVGEPYGLKYLILSKSETSLLDTVIGEAIESMLSSGIGYVAEFRELGVKNLKVSSKKLRTHYVLGMSSKHEEVSNEIEEALTYSDGIGISSPHYFTLEDLRNIFRLARNSGKLVHSHISETKDTYEERDLEKLLSVGRPDAVIHGVWLGPEELQLLKDLKITLVLCLRSNLWFMSGLPKLKNIYEIGVDVAIGTDNLGWVKPDLWREGELLLFFARSVGVNDPVWVLKTLTNTNPVSVQNYLVEGTYANILFVKYLGTPLERAHNKHLALVKRGGPELVAALMLDGRFRYLGGELEKTLRESLRDYVD
ncbi:MAG: amidohydrolase family protein [Desulfurococcaceae archaeon TW002]